MAVESGLQVVLGMTPSYAAGFAGLVFAWHHYRKRQRAGGVPRDRRRR